MRLGKLKLIETPSSLDAVAADTYWRAANYVTAVTLHLRDNVLLRRPLRVDDFKARVSGHWGTCPGVNFIYAHLNGLSSRHRLAILPVIGPGHAGAAVLANLFLEGTLEHWLPRYSRTEVGLTQLARDFGRYGGLPTEVTGAYPGMVHSGGELGLALGVAQGAALDNGRLDIVACILGDGELETGSTASAWIAAGTMETAKSALVLPIVNLNNMRMGSASLMGQLDDDGVVAFFAGMGHQAYIVRGSHTAMVDVLDHVAHLVRGRAVNRGRAVVVVRTPKGWTADIVIDGEPLSGSLRSHKVPYWSVDDPKQCADLECWFRSYRPHDIFDVNGNLSAEVIASLPPADMALGRTWGRPPLESQDSPSSLKPRYAEVGSIVSASESIASLLIDTMAHEIDRPFIVVCPDELSSNRLHQVVHEFPGQVREILNEQLCLAWLQGHALTGGRGVLATYEAFAPLMSSALTQYIKMLLSVRAQAWAPPIASMNLLITSLGWRNCFTHQNPELATSLLSKRLNFVHVHFPPDPNSAVCVLARCLGERGTVNLIIYDKHPRRVWLSDQEAAALVHHGVLALVDPPRPDAVLLAVGDWELAECMAAEQLLREYIPDLSVRVAALCSLAPSPTSAADSVGQNQRGRLLTTVTEDRPVIVCAGVYPAALAGFFADLPNPARIDIRGYSDGIDTDTRCSMLVRNGVDRFSLAATAAQVAATSTNGFAAQALLERVEKTHERFTEHLISEGRDPDWMVTSD